VIADRAYSYAMERDFRFRFDRGGGFVAANLQHVAGFAELLVGFAETAIDLRDQVALCTESRPHLFEQHGGLVPLVLQ